jgi:DNA (cytosine-5)-methyltransferase 1
VAAGPQAAGRQQFSHICQNIYRVVPIEALEAYAKAKGLKQLPKIGLAWFSPDCKHHSKAKGGKPLEKNIRDLAWVLVGWAKLPAHLRPRLIMVENVEEFADWCPLTRKGRPNKRLKGATFEKWAKTIKRYGYKMEFRRDVVAADKGTPTTRKRLVVIFRNDALPIVFRHGNYDKPKSPAVITGKRRPWRTAAEIIDWSLPCPSIFDSAEQIMEKHGLRAQRPLAENTLARVARGVFRYVIDAAEPFIVPITHTGDSRVHGIGEPMRTITTAQRGEHALITPLFVRTDMQSAAKRNGVHGPKEPVRTITTHGGIAIVAPLLCAHYGEGNGGLNRAARADEPVRTITCDPRHSVVAAFLAQHNTDMVGHDAREPVSTIVGKGCTQAVVSAGLLSLKGTERRGGSIENPIPAITAGGFHIAEVRAFLTKFHRDGGQWQDLRDPLGTGGAKDRFGLVIVKIGGVPYAIVDIGMRMLTPNELKLAMGFRRDYIIDRGLFADGWRPITKTAQVRLVGNAVCPQVAEDAVEANYTPMKVNFRGVPEFALQAAE